jgi:GH15 family glucan-1,4-alpha-glucosidase
LPTAVSRIGCVDGSIWQYNHEWLRDQSVVALALTMLGATGPAKTMLTRLLDKFVTPEGDTLDSSVKRNPAEVELDQNGYLLCTLKDYALWTGDLDLIRAKWAKVTAVAEFPLQPIFRHQESGLLQNCREFWERHAIHGIQPGMELSYQLWVSEGLAAAAVLARLTGHSQQAVRWDAESARLRRAMLSDRRFKMHDRRGFIKRRAPDGRVQETVTASRTCGLPDKVPLMSPGPHRLNPDASAVLPIVFGTVAADSAVARRTFRSIEQLWNQAGNGGGYGRYHVTSEPDSPGGWPFASLFVARAAVEARDDAKVWRILRWLDTVPGAKAGTWFEFYGERIAPPLPQVGIVVWNWAELVVLYVRHILGIQPGEDGVSVQPRLLAGLSAADATITIRGRRRRLRVTKKGRSGRVAVVMRGTVATKPGVWHLGY